MPLSFNPSAMTRRPVAPVASSALQCHGELWPAIERVGSFAGPHFLEGPEQPIAFRVRKIGQARLAVPPAPGLTGPAERWKRGCMRWRFSSRELRLKHGGKAQHLNPHVTAGRARPGAGGPQSC